MFGKSDEKTAPEIAGLEELIALLNEKIKGGLKSRKKPAVDPLAALAGEAEPEMEVPAEEPVEAESSEVDPADLESALAALGTEEDDEDELV